RFGPNFPGGVFWLCCSLPDEVPAQVGACGGSGAMNLRADFADLTLDEKVRLVRDAWRMEVPRLLVFDDCEDESLLREWLPGGGGAHVLVTRREPEVGILRLPVLPLGGLSRDESLALLGAYRPDERAGGPAMGALAEELGHLPLALRLAGGFLRLHHDVSVDAYLGRLRSPEAATPASPPPPPK